MANGQYGIRLLIVIFLVTGIQLYAAGKREAADDTSHNNEWILCVTEFNTGSMPEDKLNIASVITRKIVERLSVISYRTRISGEYAYYEENAWSGVQAGALKNLADKQNERSLLAYRGDPSWKYRRDLAKADEDIKKLKETLDEVNKKAPVINNSPEFKLASGNLNFSFPAPPAHGSESKFCADHKADAFLAGTIMDFHGRYHVSLKLYALYTRSIIWEDSIIFSSGDLDSAMDEISSRLLNVLSGGRLASITVRAEPEEALILINSSFAGRGETPALEHPPGKFTINVSAAEHESLTLETELSAGETADIVMRLKPLQYANVEIPGSSSLSGTVYHGAMYVGETPLILRLPVNMLEYVELETSDKKKGSAVFQTPQSAGSEFTLTVSTSISLEKGRVDKARRMYYWAWGGTWITGIAAWIFYHSYISSDFAIRYDNTVNGSYDQKFADNNVALYYFSMGTVIAVVSAVAYEIFHIIRYVYISDKGSTPVVKRKGSK